MADKTLKTRRLTLRPLRAADAPRMAALVNDIDIARMTTSIPHPFTLADAEGFLARVAGADPDRETVFAVEPDGEGFAGVLGFHQKDDGEPGPALGPEIGYWLGRPYWGRGYMSEAASAATAWAGEAENNGGWGKRVVVSGHFADNPASGQVLVKAGFLYTGEVQQRMSKARGETAATRMMVWLA
jgi:RimJ/RimL family protein N-acetyltransferase